MDPKAAFPVFRVERETGDVEAYFDDATLRLVVEEFWDVLEDEFEFWDAQARRVRFSASYLSADPSGIAVESGVAEGDLSTRLAEYAARNGVALTDAERTAPPVQEFEAIIKRMKAGRPPH